MATTRRMVLTRDSPAHSGLSISMDKPAISPFPLNSRRLMSSHLKSMAKALDLLTTGTVDKKLTEMGWDPKNVQVIVVSDPHSQEILFERHGWCVHQCGDFGGGGYQHQRQWWRRAWNKQRGGHPLEVAAWVLPRSSRISEPRTRSFQLTTQT